MDALHAEAARRLREWQDATHPVAIEVARQRYLAAVARLNAR